MFLFFSIWHWFWGTFGCFLNSILIYMAICKSPKAIRSYATLIINFAITDFVECVLDLFIQIRLIPAPGDVTIIYILNGVCKYIGPHACTIGTSFFLHCIPHSVWPLLLSFAYRYYILGHSALSRSTIVKILMIIYIPSLFQGLTYWTGFVEREEILPLARKWFPDYNFDEETGVITGIIDLTYWATIFGISHLCFPIFPVYTAIFIFRRKIIQHLERSASMMAKETKAAHSQLLKALTYQLTYLHASFRWYCCVHLLSQSGAIVSPILQYSLFSSVILMPSLSPLTYLLFVKPYRVYLKTVLANKVQIVYREDASKSGRFDSTGARAPSHFETAVITVQ